MIIIIIIIVRTRFADQAQGVWDLGPVSPIQQICKEWVKKLGFSAWITVNMVFMTIKQR